MYELEVLPEAVQENEQVVSWLIEHVSVERAGAYATAILRALDEVIELPFAWPRWKTQPDVHVRHLRRISYSIVYRRDGVVLVIAFAHMRRRPGYWLDRL